LTHDANLKLSLPSTGTGFAQANIAGDLNGDGSGDLLVQDSNSLYVLSGATLPPALGSLQAGSLFSIGGSFVLGGDTIGLAPPSTTNLQYSGTSVVIIPDLANNLAATTASLAPASGNNVFTVHVRSNGTSSTASVVSAINALATGFTASGGSSPRARPPSM
jgi:hypothetical protein